MSNQLTPIALMAKADRACLSARALFNLGDVDGACNRAYYAMFDAARAALLASGAPVRPDIGKTHSGLINAFSEHLIKNGPISKELGRLLKRAEEIRLVADYKGDSVELSDAQEMVTQAETELPPVPPHQPVHRWDHQHRQQWRAEHAPHHGRCDALHHLAACAVAPEQRQQAGHDHGHRHGFGAHPQNRAFANRIK